MNFKQVLILAFILCTSYYCEAQLDSTIEALQKIPNKYISNIENKIDKYSTRITSKTEKTLTKLSRWENKIKGILEQVSPETAQKLFGNNQITFSTLLQKLKEGEALAEGYKTKYNEYRDKLTTSIKYLDEQKDKLNKNLLGPINDTKKKLNELDEDVSNTEAVEQFIKERRKQLLNEAVKYIGKSKYLTKIDKEAYYYVETLRNYKELFSDKKKTEELALKILNKIPAFKTFVQDNSMLAQLFGSPNNPTSMANLQGLQTRASINTLIQNQIATGGPNAQQQIIQNIQGAQAELSKLKDKVTQMGGSNSDMGMPDFKPNEQKTKTFLQRLEVGTNFQTTKGSSYLPKTTDLALSIGYKINNKSIIGIGASYKLGLGGDINHIKLSSEGAGLRSFVDYKLKKSFWVSGGAEMNYHSKFSNIEVLQDIAAWQTSALIGVTKKYNINKKLKGNIQLLYDFLYLRNVPVKQPVVFRVGYNF